MSNILNIKNLDGDWDSIVAIRGKKGDKGEDGTKFEVNARFVPGNNVVPIADFITDKGTTKETTHTIYAPKGEGGGTTVEYTDLHTFTDTMTVGEISVDGESTEVVIPANVSEFANDAGYVTRNTNVSTFNNDAGYVTEDAIPTKVSELENDSDYLKSEYGKIKGGVKFDLENSREEEGSLAIINVGDDDFRINSSLPITIKAYNDENVVIDSPLNVIGEITGPTITDIYSKIESGGGSTEKYMPGDVVYAGIIELYSASTGSSGVYILDKEVDESVSSISVEVDTRAYTQQNPQYTMRGAGKTVSAPEIDVTVDELNRKRLDLKTSERTTANYLNIVSWVKFVFS